MTTQICGRLVTVSVDPPEMTECGLSPEHEGECTPYTKLKSKRKVSYNQNVVLCQTCKKRIRLNNNGRVRVHVMDKFGSDECKGSAVFLGVAPETIVVPHGTPSKKAEPAPLEVQYPPITNLFSDYQQ